MYEDVVKKDLIKTSLEKAAQLKLDRDAAPKSDTRSPLPPRQKGYVLSKKLLGPLLGGEVASRDVIPVEKWGSLGACTCSLTLTLSTRFCLQQLLDTVAGNGMYYDKAFEVAEKGGCMLRVPEQTKVDCLYDLHYR